MRHVAERYKDPLTEPVFLILLSLAEEPRHGFAMLKDIEALSNGRVRMSTGTLYGAIPRLLESGWIKRRREPEAPRDRQAYELTAAGRDVLHAEIDRMKLLARVASLRLARTEA
jgi:DNA-binding PadR family transcriptional regulator